MHRVSAAADEFSDRIGGAVHDVGVIAGSTHEGVDAGTAIENVGRAVARDHVVGRVAGAIDGRNPGEGEVLHVGQGSQREGHAGLNRIRTFRSQLGDRVGGAVHDVEIVAKATDQGVSARATIKGVVTTQTTESVVGAVAEHHVVGPVAGAIDGRQAGEGEVLHVGQRNQRERDTGLDRVGAAKSQFGDHIGGGVHDVGIVSGSTHEDVNAGAAIENIVASITGDQVVAGIAGGVDVGSSSQGDVFNIGRKRIAH